MHSNKAFLGPIGDDLPSLIPIIFGLVIFFAVFNLGFQTFQDRSKSFNSVLTVLTVADVLKGESIINNYDDFQNKCKKINVSGIKFKAVLIEFPEPQELSGQGVFSIHDLINFDEASPGTIFESKENKKFKCPEEDIYEVPDDKSIIVRIFPIAIVDDSIQTKAQFAVKPVFLVVALWS